jgi:N-acetylmuramoyl-L-alanine amidase
MRKITKIIVHCSATQEGANFDVQDIRRWHKQRGFKDIGYHYIITLDGDIQIGRDIQEPGAHAKGYNKNSIAICYIGGLDKNLTPKDTRNIYQKLALKMMISGLKTNFPDAVILGHRDLPNVKKACPCFDAKEEYKNIK